MRSYCPGIELNDIVQVCGTNTHWDGVRGRVTRAAPIHVTIAPCDGSWPDAGLPWHRVPACNLRLIERKPSRELDR
jgi:hypothetical protein